VKRYVFWCNVVLVGLAFLGMGCMAGGWIDSSLSIAIFSWALDHWVLTIILWVSLEGFVFWLGEQDPGDGSEPKYPPGHCRHCGYDLRASPVQCPECGAFSRPVRGRRRDD
jgi:hypothetical protein